VSLTSPSGARLVIGSPSTAQDGRYQEAIRTAGKIENVEKQMIDRILDQATTLATNHYGYIHVVLSVDDYTSLTGRTPALLKLLLTALSPNAKLHFSNLSAEVSAALSPQLVLAGFVTQPGATSALVAQKPATSSNQTNGIQSSEPASSGPATSIPLPRRLGKNSGDKSSKKRLWVVAPPLTPSIDATALLTSEDLARPVPVCEPPDTGTPRRKKACKGCTCGLAEQEVEEAEAAKRTRVVVLLDGDEAKAVPLSEKQRLVEAAEMAPKATSSCGSCYLGDAFRCASCPYMGLPAFEPGQKVEIDFGMDDL